MKLTDHEEEGCVSHPQMEAPDGSHPDVPQGTCVPTKCRKSERLFLETAVLAAEREARYCARRGRRQGCPRRNGGGGEFWNNLAHKAGAATAGYLKWLAQMSTSTSRPSLFGSETGRGE